MDPKYNDLETFQCQYCLVYVQKKCQQVHEANCSQFKKQNQQGINNNQDAKHFIPNSKQNQSKDLFIGFKQISIKPISQIQHQQNNTGIQNLQKNEITQFPKPLIQNLQFQDNQKNGNQQNSQQYNQSDLNQEGQFQVNRLFPKEQQFQNIETNNKQIPQQRFPQTPLVSQQNTFQKLILLPKQQQNSNIFQTFPDQGFNQNQNKQQIQQGPIQNQQQNQEQQQLFRTQNNVNINQQQNIPNFGRIDNFQQKHIKINPNNNNIFQNNKNIQQIQPQQIQQQQINNSQSLFSSTQFPNSFNQIQPWNNYQSGNTQNNSNSQPIQGQPCLPLQFPAPQIPQNIQPPPFISSIFPRLQYNLSDDDDDKDDDDDDDEYDSFNINNRGLPNFDINKQYTDVDVNRMNQEQVYQYFSNLFINENHGYTEDQINQKISQKNFTMKLEDNRIDLCVICQESFTSETFTTDKQLPCSHLFHEVCLKGWLKRSKQCPICKAEVEL